MNQSTRSEHPAIQKQHSGHNNYNNAVAVQKTSVAPTTRTEAPVRASPSSYYTPTTTTTTSSYSDFVRKNSNNDFYSEL